ncbi:hypothetical protein [Pseudoponticoccus marisrubri]|uniref:Uncharacterized protein n=1 Tax=Pseudoponticoccus marisrubri TaxID=1685382 RepID=A0A0W7WP92_9RHOB|nr:hypothetical protein [Pseudoponticoccus marisrubri]KUF12399.1 hypothetical protein AVJ23_01320 [Pseudoponticoccus marisrubri]
MQTPDTTLYPSEQRASVVASWAEEALLKGQEDALGKVFWRLIAEEWTGFDAIPHGWFHLLFHRMRPYLTNDVMRPEDSAAFNALPEEFTIYRGTDAEALPGLSWTLDRQTALEFARGHRGIENSAPVLLSTSVKRSDVALFLKEREEAEILLFAPPKAPSVEEPTAKELMRPEEYEAHLAKLAQIDAKLAETDNI